MYIFIKGNFVLIFDATRLCIYLFKYCAHKYYYPMYRKKISKYFINYIIYEYKFKKYFYNLKKKSNK